MQDFQWIAPTKAFQAIEDIPVLQGQAVDHAAHHRRFIARHRLALCLTGSCDSCRHIADAGERRVVRVDKGNQGRGGLGQRNHVREFNRFASLIPDAPAFLEDPQAVDILEQANRFFNADLVGKVFRQDIRAQAGLGKFRAEQ